MDREARVLPGEQDLEEVLGEPLGAAQTREHETTEVLLDGGAASKRAERVRSRPRAR